MLIIPALPQFVEKYPEIHLDIGCSERVADLVQEGVDCAIRGGIISDQDLVCRPIGQMQFCLCASPKYLASAPAIFSPDDLPKHRHLGFKFPISGRRHIPTLHRGEDSFTLDHVPAMYFNSGSANVAASVAGLGITFLPRAEAEPHFKSGALVEVLPDWNLQSMPMSLVYPYTRLLSARVRAFTEWATKLMAENPLWSIKG
jgi:DNA-binding transcriptional LysR family regulator